jgi:hypothetical protein
MNTRLLLLGLGGVAGACRPSSPAPASFDEAVRAALTSYDADDVTYAPIARALEAQIYQSVPSQGSDTLARSLDPAGLTADDVVAMSPRPEGADPSACLDVSLAWASPYDLGRHAPLALIADQTPLEPSSPDHYDRTFLEGEDCWDRQGCPTLRTVQDLTKVYTGNIIPPITYRMYKDFRWVDLNADLGGEPRWAYLARSWSEDAAYSENGRNGILQSWTIEAWFPRDGAGFVWGEVPAPSEEHGDSTGAGTLRLLTLWTETDLALTEDPELQVGTMRWGMEQNMKAHDAWLSEN